MMPPPTLTDIAVRPSIAAYVIEALLEVFFWAIYLLLSGLAVYLAVTRRRREGVVGNIKTRLLHGTLGLQFLLVAVHSIGTVYGSIYAFGNLDIEAAAAFFLFQGRYSGVEQATRIAGILVIPVTDALVIHRAYVIYNQGIKIILPSLILLLCELVASTGTIYRSLGINGIYDKSCFTLSNPWVSSALTASILISSYSTGTIWWKIWRTNKAVKQFSAKMSAGMKLTSILAIIVESAAIQTVTAIALLVTFENEFIGQVIFVGIGPAILGISTVLIHVRIGLGLAVHEPETHSKASSNVIQLGSMRAELGENVVALCPSGTDVVSAEK
ncbi:unnamed protein product [Mycena citricolor]|uniref:Uncharacterized protein n=1 Tax=Mycena citricolor TaxID=2018698 RepID=A0AAD2K432_9AGAR|nr:unnamed protein product [Mycena citricolor]